MKISTTDPVVAALTILLANTNTVVTASNFNTESYLSSAWALTNIPSQPNITPFALALSSIQAADASAVKSAASKYHITATGLSATTITATSNPAVQMVTPAPAAYLAALGVGGIIGAAVMM